MINLSDIMSHWGPRPCGKQVFPQSFPTALTWACHWSSPEGLTLEAVFMVSDGLGHHWSGLFPDAAML